MQDPALDRQEMAEANRRRAAMRAFMEAYDLTPAEWARRAGLPNANTIYNFLNSHSHSLTQVTLEKLAKAVPGATVTELIGETPSQRPMNVIVLPVRVVAAAGVWRPTYEAPQMIEVEISMSPKVAADEAARIADDHADQVYPAGSYIAIQAIAAMSRDLLHGDRVLVHRVRSSRHEVTVRELRVIREQGKAERAELVFRSNRPNLGGAMPIPWPYRGELFEAGDTRAQIRGRVVLMTMLHDAP